MTEQLDVATVASLLHCSEETVRRRARKGVIPAYKWPGSTEWAFDPDDIRKARDKAKRRGII